MKATFLDYLAEVTVSDYIGLGKQTRSHVLPDDLMLWLRSKGYDLVDKFKAEHDSLDQREFATGAYATVYIKNDNDPYVLKVARKPDQCWLDFIKMARSSRNPHFPRVTSLREWPTKKDPEDSYFLAMIERLHPLPLITDFKEEHVPILMGLFNFIAGGAFRGKVIRTIQHYLGEEWTQNRIRVEGYKFMGSKHPFAKAYQKAEALGCDIDMHEYNVMMRLPEQTIVITDPIS